MKKSIVLSAMLALLLLGAGGLVYYLYGYKDSLWIQGTAYILIIFGWLCVLLMMALLHPPKLSAEQVRNRTWQLTKHRLYFISYLVWLVALVASFVGVEMLKDKRVDSVLARPDAAYTTATVIQIEERRLKNSTHTYAVIVYDTPAGGVQQAIKDDEGLYRPGQQIRLLYAPQYPDMFRVATPSYSVP